jgi:hypothetical protein
MKKYTISVINVIKNTNIPEEFCLSSPGKISLKSNCAFNLPAGPEFSCPVATEACEKCYARKGHHVFVSVQSVMAKNWVLMNELERLGDKDRAVNLLLDKIKPSTEIFRIHESGDFHSQFSINMWSDLVRKRKQTLFWAYTRSFDFDYSKLVRHKNFVLWASTDDFNEKQANAFVKRYSKSNVKHAYGPYNHDKELPEKSFTCPVTNHKMEMDGACARCKLCIIKGRAPKHVVFLAH